MAVSTTTFHRGQTIFGETFAELAERNHRALRGACGANRRTLRRRDFRNESVQYGLVIVLAHSSGGYVVGALAGLVVGVGACQVGDGVERAGRPDGSRPLFERPQ